MLAGVESFTTEDREDIRLLEVGEVGIAYSPLHGVSHRGAGVPRMLRRRSRMGEMASRPAGRSTGGDFNHIPLCSSSTQTGCVVAYSSFTTKPPSNSQFGRTTSDAGVSLLAPHNILPNIAIACVNPAAPAGGQTRLDP